MSTSWICSRCFVSVNPSISTCPKCPSTQSYPQVTVPSLGYPPIVGTSNPPTSGGFNPELPPYWSSTSGGSFTDRISYEAFN